MGSKYYLGIDLGGTKLLAALATQEGKLITQLTIPTEADQGPKKVIQNMIQLGDELLRCQGKTRNDLAAIGIGSPGQIQSQAGLVIEPPNLPGWKRVPLRKSLSQAFPVPIFIENDANCAALAEQYYGAGKGCQDFLYLTISTGIGGGLILNGQLYRGTREAAGEVGHMIILPGGPLCGCGRAGCLEALASGTAITKGAQEQIKKLSPQHRKKSLILKLAGSVEAITTKLIGQAAQKGDPLAKQLFEEAGYYLGIGIANLINIFNPEKVVLGGGVMANGSLLLAPVKKVANTIALRVPRSSVSIVPAQLKQTVGAYGALALCLSHRQ